MREPAIFFDWFALVENWNAQTTITLCGIVAAAAVAVYAVERTHRRAMQREDRQRDAIKRGHFAAFAAEVNMISEVCRGYLSSNILMPAYRVPVFALSASYPALLGLGELTQQDATAILRFYTCVNSFNSGLDLSRETHTQGGDRFTSELRRTTIKAYKCLPRGAENPSLYDEVAAVLVRHGVETFVPHPAKPLPETGLADMARRIDTANQLRIDGGFDPIDDAN